MTRTIKPDKPGACPRGPFFFSPMMISGTDDACSGIDDDDPNTASQNDGCGDGIGAIAIG